VRDDVTLVGDALHERPLAPVLADRVRGHQLAAADVDDLGVTDMVDTDDNEAGSPARSPGRRGRPTVRWWSMRVMRVNPTGAGPVGSGGDTAALAAAGASRDSGTGDREAEGHQRSFAWKTTPLETASGRGACG
jgi:hypothetical protein